MLTIRFRGWSVLFRAATIGPLFGFLLALSLLFTGAPAIGAADDFGQPVAGRHIYDTTGLLTSAEIADLETRAAAVERAGAPVVVYLRAKDANQDDTMRDARALMDTWNVQSAQDARDGVVIFLNVKPNDLRHGQAAIWAGARHTQNGNLPQRELERIYDKVMKPSLSDGQTAAGIAAGLDALANSLAVGPPPPSATQQFATKVGGLPAAIFAVIVGGVLALFSFRSWGGRPAPVAPGVPTTSRPGDLPPALVGALTARRIEPGTLAEATLLDFARRGALAIVPQGEKAIAVRLLTAARPQLPFEQIVWSALMREADTDGMVPAKRVAQATKSRKEFAGAIDREMHARGWFDPAFRSRQIPLYIVGVISMVLAFGVLILASIGEQPWGFFGFIVLILVGCVVLLLGAYYPRTTAAGEAAAAPWQAYKAGLKSAARDQSQALDLDVVLPDAVAFGLVSALDRRLKEASARGYAPSWFLRQSGQGNSFVAFYPYWILFHSSASPASSGAGSGGASAGGAGAGGSF